MSTTVTVMDVSARDGLQNEPELLSTHDKLELIQRGIDAGAKRLEVSSFVHPKRVPQMADAEAVCAGLPVNDAVRYTGLIMNERGYDRLLATERLHEAGLVIPATDTFGERNQGMSVEDNLAMIKRVAADARSRRFPIQVTIAAAFGCPFEGEVSTDAVVDIAKALADEELVELALADTIGVGVPLQVEERFAAVRQALGSELPLRAHFHDTRNTANANAYAAVRAGVQTLDASIGGIGGCPFAPNATGNIAAEDLVYMLERMGVQTTLSLTALIDAADWLQTVLGKRVPSMLLKAGAFPSPDSASSAARE